MESLHYTAPRFTAPRCDAGITNRTNKPVEKRCAVGRVVRLQVSGEVGCSHDEARNSVVRRGNLVGSRNAQRGFDHAPAVSSIFGSAAKMNITVQRRE